MQTEIFSTALILQKGIAFIDWKTNEKYLGLHCILMSENDDFFVILCDAIKN